jgi:hypothetical protein
MSAMPDVLTVVDTVERCWDQEHAAREDGDLLVAECFARIAQDLYHTFAVGDRSLRRDHNESTLLARILALVQEERTDVR